MATQKVIPIKTVSQTQTKVFCVHVDDYLLSPMCPLPSGACYWQHRNVPRCMYDKEFAGSDFSIEDFCKRVGISVPTPDTVNNLKEQMLDKVRKALSE